MVNADSDFKQLTDEALCAFAAQGSTEAEEQLVARHARLVRICARPFFLAGGDSEDLIQEGMFGLLRAIRTFDPLRQVQFRTYAEVCIRTKLISAVRSAASGKHMPLNTSVPLECEWETADPAAVPEDPETALICREEQGERLSSLTGQLTGFEAAVLRLYLSGLSYSEIARQTGKPAKSVDNAVQRIRRKVERQLNSGDISQG